MLGDWIHGVDDLLAGLVKGLCMRKAICLVVLVIVAGCGRDPKGLQAEELSNLLSITNLSAQPVYDRGDPPRIVAVRIEADVVHVGDVPINEPFVLTWRLVDDRNETVGEVSKRLEGNMQPGAVRRVTLTVEFEARESVAGLRNVATFDPVSG